MDDYRINLSESGLPQAWYNVQPDLPRPLPPYLQPAPGQPVGSQDLALIPPWEIIIQEPERAISDEVLRLDRR